MPRTKCQHCDKLFTFRVGAEAAKVVCTFCRQRVAVARSTALVWFVARGSDRQGPFTWDQLVAMGARGEIGFEDLLIQSGQADGSLASAYPELFAEKLRETSASEDADSVLPGLRDRLRALMAQLDPERTSEARTEPAALAQATEKESAPQEAALPMTPPAPAREIPAITARRVDLPAIGPAFDEPMEHPGPTEPPAAAQEPPPLPTPAAPIAMSPVTSAPASRTPPLTIDPAMAVASDVPASSFWHFANSVSASATAIVAACALVFWLRFGMETGTYVPPAPERGMEEQEIANPRPKIDPTPHVAPLTSAAWTSQFVEELNRHRRKVGLRDVEVAPDVCKACVEHARNLAHQAESHSEAKPSEGSLVCRAEPAQVLEIWMGRIAERSELLDRELHAIGVGFERGPNGDWVCVANPIRAAADPMYGPRLVLCPAPNQKDVPCLGFDSLEEAATKAGFPITATFPKKAVVRNVQARLVDEGGKSIDLRIVTADPLPGSKSQYPTIGLQPLTPLDPGRSYTIILLATVNGTEWRQSWQFTTVRLATVE